MLTAERLRELVRYEPDTGYFFWQARDRRMKVGSRAGTHSLKGYWQIQLDWRLYFAHRLAWLYITGEWPTDQIDHINMIRDDNRWENLREATPTQNNANARKHRDNISGFKGVGWSKHNAKWRASIKKRYLGYFDTPEEAHAAYCKAASELFGEFSRTS